MADQLPPHQQDGLPYDVIDLKRHLLKAGLLCERPDAPAMSMTPQVIRCIENDPSAKKAMTSTVTVGTIRKIVTTAKNGSSGRLSRIRRPTTAPGIG